MKVFWILIFLAAADCDEIVKPNTRCSGEFLQNAIKRCAQAYGATEDDLKDVIYFKPAANHKMKCFRACVFTECKAFTNDGSLVANIPQTTAFLTSRRNASHYQIVEEIGEDCLNKLSSYDDTYVK
uniref:Uncharacterized protein n=1 Tax=Musca domestica TaxID=7370 RepID=A0A1I8NER2_MUSDO